MERIAVIVGKMDSGGKKNLIMEYYRHIDRSQIQFDFICDKDSQAIPEEEITALGGRVYRIARYENLPANLWEILRLCQKNRYRIVHAYNSTLNIFPMAVAWAARVPVRINESLSTGHKGDKRNVIKNILRPFSGKFANYYMACGEGCGQWQFGDRLYSEGKVQIFKTVVNTWFNRYDPQLRAATRAEYGWEDKILVGHIGRLTAQKNSVRLVDIFDAAARQEPKAHLCLIGDGDKRQAVLNRIRELGLEDRVSYLGRREDIQQFYNAMDVFLLPSLYEGLPVVGLEAESCGLPTIFSDQIARESNACELGQFVPLEESNEHWARVTLKAAKDNMPVRRSHHQEVARAGFDSKAEALRLQKFYQEALREQCGKK